MSEVLDKIKSRRSIRKYRSDMIPQDKYLPVIIYLVGVLTTHIPAYII